MDNSDKVYREIIDTETLWHFRILAVTGSPVMLLFSFLDRIMYPEQAAYFFTLRLIVAFFIAFFFAATFLPFGRRLSVWLADLAIAIPSISICLMIYSSDGIRSHYYQGLNVCFMAMFVANSFYFSHSVITGFVVLFFYFLAVRFHPLGIDWPTYISNNFFLAGTVFFVAVLTKIYQVQHYKEYKKTQEVSETAKKLEEAYKKLRASEKLKDEFFANVSHELRTPLTLILAPLESLLGGEYGPLADPNQTQIMRTMHNNAIRLLQMIAGLLDFSKLGAGKISVQRESLDIVLMTRRLLNDFMPWVRQKSQTIEFFPENETIPVEMDRYLYERILYNLLSNAVKFTPERGVITVRLSWQSGRLRLSVQDTGIGIDDADRENLFQKFRQLEGSARRRFEGTGLGLALVKEFSALLGGDVFVSSQKDRGSTFTVECEAVKALAVSGESLADGEQSHSLIQRYLDTQDHELIAQGPGASVGLFGDEKPRVLIAEDNAELAYYVSSLLSDSCAVKIACDGEEAMRVAREWAPVLVLSDIMMPKKDGLAFCRELKSDPSTSSIPVVLLTALTHRDALLRGWEAGADEYLFKPFHPTELVTRVRSLVSNNQARKKAEERTVKKASELARAQEELAQLQLFAHITTHDLQEPLRKIMFFSDRLKCDLMQIPPEESLQRLEKISDSAKKLSWMIKGLRDLSQVEQDRIQPEPVNLDEIIKEVLSSLELVIAETGTEMTVGPLPTVSADFFQMFQLFTNLIHNGIKFCRQGEAPRVSITCQQAGADFAEIQVGDQGIGFDAKYAEKIFEPFQRLHGDKEYSGTGLGLAIAEKIVLRHQGKIWAESEPGRGTVFTVRLPVWPARK